MADPIIPHFVNNIGSENIRVGVTKFKCIGANAPFDHPHVFLDMTSDKQIVCPYCSTLYVYDENLAPTETNPEGCLVEELV